MTTWAERRVELAEALTDAEVAVAPTSGRIGTPCVLIYGDGIDDLRGVGRGQLPAGLRMVLVAGRADQEATADQLDALTVTVLGVLRALEGWRLGTVRPDTIRKLGANEYLTRDVTAAVMVDIT